jgi:predicted nucleic acid-binding protein
VILLDTNVISEVSRPRPEENVVRWFSAREVASLYLCAPVLMEQFYGAERFRLRKGSDRFVRSAERLQSETFAGRVLPFDSSAARLTGAIRAKREASGRPISVVDAMIAAICLAHEAMLATRNVRDFEGLDLKLVNPFEATA